MNWGRAAFAASQFGDAIMSAVALSEVAPGRYWQPAASWLLVSL